MSFSLLIFSWEDLANPALSLSSDDTGPAALQWILAGFLPVQQYHFCCEEPKTGQSTPHASLQKSNTEEHSPL